MSAAGAGAITHPDIGTRAVLLAGVLAECAVATVAIVDDDGWIEFQARETDLPGLIIEAVERGGADLLALDRPLRIGLHQERFDWVSDDQDAAARLAALDPAAAMDEENR
ncbi:MAG: hypothetical protein EA379_04655 [Phycisphaerales bacterium]|nr:MAG: hypothetical protein EA379_04655 [Phycisphaerales bacterium]